MTIMPTTTMRHTESMRARFTDTATTLLDTNRRVVVLTADIGAAGFQEARRRHPHRVINVGIREQLLISAAAGFALEGFRPIVHSYAPFLVERPYEQIKLDLTHQGVGAILVSTGASFDASSEGRTHQAPADVSILAAFADWQIHVPGHADEFESLLRTAASETGNVYLRMSEQMNANPHAIDGMTRLRRGSDGSPLMLAVGPMLDPVVDAVRDLDVSVAYTPTVKPLDHAGLRDIMSGSDVVVVEPNLEGSSASAISAALVDRAHRLLSIGVSERELHRYGRPAEHAAAHGLDAEGIRARVEGFLGR